VPELGDVVRAREQSVGKLALLAMQLDDALLDRIFGDEAIHGHRSFLSDAVRAVRGLRFDRWMTDGERFALALALPRL
jgi:hypothetical protein